MTQTLTISGAGAVRHVSETKQRPVVVCATAPGLVAPLVAVPFVSRLTFHAVTVMYMYVSAGREGLQRTLPPRC